MDQKQTEDIKNGRNTIVASEGSHDQVHNSTANPPPPYSQVQNAARMEVPDPRQEQILASPAYPPQSYHTQAPSRTLHFYENFMGSSNRVLDTDDSTLLYTVKMHLRKPNIVIDSASTGTTIGTVVSHTLTTRIDATVRDSSITLTSRGFWKTGYTYPSTALGGEVMTWKTIGSNLDLVCTDQTGVSIAMFRFSNWSSKKRGKLEMLGPKAQSGAAMEEIIVTALAFAEVVLAMRSSS